MKLTKRQLIRIIESNLKGGFGDDMKPTKTLTNSDYEEINTSLPQGIEVSDDFIDDNPMDRTVNRRTFLKGLLGLTATFIAGGILKLTGLGGRQYKGNQVDLNGGSISARYCKELFEAIKKYQPQWLEPGNPIRYFMDASEMEGTGGGAVYPYAFDANTQTFYHVTEGDLEGFLLDAYGPENLSKLLDYQIQQLRQEIAHEKSQENIAIYEKQIRDLQSPNYLPEIGFYEMSTLSNELNIPMPEGLYYFDHIYGLQRYQGGGESTYYAPGIEHAHDGGIEIDQKGRKVFINLDSPRSEY